ncbi:hypothetical protein [Peredibacter starrii]|uniref:Uncharacterized protein n=1 Tax=Peredibacter starrii TaxID=28202 RepID=A0AAX4HLF1_9BACT|nr:hypothetical protein [Peredibacter starrii]WPU64147.1 hypothetical protein SOO65_15745 [Peredibacter starrii]
MKNFKLIFVAVTLFSSAGALALDPTDCQTEPGPVSQFIDAYKKVENGMYKNIFDMKVNMDGDGKIAVYYEKGEPKILKLSYKNKNGEVTKTITFEELAQGKELIYENKDIPGKAIVLSRGEPFNDGDDFKFKLGYRSSVKPDKLSNVNLNFDSTYVSPKVAANGKEFKKMVLSPGVSFLSWDGTFKKVEFQP